MKASKIKRNLARLLAATMILTTVAGAPLNVSAQTAQDSYEQTAAGEEIDWEKALDELIAKVRELDLSLYSWQSVQDLNHAFQMSYDVPEWDAEFAYEIISAAYEALELVNYESNGLIIRNNFVEDYAGHGGMVTIPDGVVGIDSGVFKDRDTIVRVSFPESLFAIGDSAFENCTGLTGNLILPMGLEHVGDNAFAGCTGLKSITFLGYRVPYFAGQLVPESDTLEVIYVPYSVLDKYEEALAGKIGKETKILTYGENDSHEIITNARVSKRYSRMVELAWDLCKDPRIEYYDVYRTGVYIGKTYDGTFVDKGPGLGNYEVYSIWGCSRDGYSTSEALIFLKGLAGRPVSWEAGDAGTVTDEENTVEVVFKESVVREYEVRYSKLGDQEMRLYYMDGSERKLIGEPELTDSKVEEVNYVEEGPFPDDWDIYEMDTYTIDWDVTDLAAGEYELVLVLSDPDGECWSESKTVYVSHKEPEIDDPEPEEPALDTEAPIITSVSPGAKANIAKTKKFKMTAEDNVGITQSYLSYSVDYGEHWILFASGTTGSLSGSLDTTKLPDGDLLIEAVAFDEAGNVGSTVNVYQVNNSKNKKNK